MPAESARHRTAVVSFPIGKQSVVGDFAPKHEGISTPRVPAGRMLQKCKSEQDKSLVSGVCRHSNYRRASNREFINPPEQLFMKQPNVHRTLTFEHPQTPDSSTNVPNFE